MREILFRAKAINRKEGFEYRTNYKNGDWVYGLITKKEVVGNIHDNPDLLEENKWN